MFAAIYAQVIWLLIPAIIIGLNALAFQFCALTGQWGWWAVLWIIEPLSVGLALLAVNVKVRSSALSIAGLILCGLAGAGFLLMITVLGAWWPVGLLGPTILVYVQKSSKSCIMVPSSDVIGRFVVNHSISHQRTFCQLNGSSIRPQ